MPFSRREPWLREDFTLSGVPAMVSRSEQRYLHWLTRTLWRDVGHVVEIGPWLGGSTVCLARGMRAACNARGSGGSSARDGRSATTKSASHGASSPRHRLHAFDNFTWRGFMSRFAPLPLADGESFERYFLENVRDARDLVVSHVLTLPDETIADDVEAVAVRGTAAAPLDPFTWDPSEPIEILFVDGAKSWRGMRWLLSRTAPSLRAGGTLLVCQDFKHWASSWVPLMIARIRAKLELVHVVRRGSTATFRLTAPLGSAEIDALCDDVTKLDTRAALADIESMAQWIAGTGDALGAAHVRLGAVQLLAHHGRPEEAARRFDDVQAGWPLRGSRGQLEDARRYLAERGLATAPYHLWSRLPRFVGSRLRAARTQKPAALG